MNRLNEDTIVVSAVQEVLKPILYADIFDYPLTLPEIYKFIEIELSVKTVDQLLEQAIARGQLISVDGFYCLAGRAHLAATRQARQKAAELLWPQAIRYGRLLAALPFIRFVAVTGALAVNNPRDNVDDIDFLIVTQPGRLWLCRAMMILLVRFGHTQGVHLCPNYIITENKLFFENFDLFTAREILQMQPLYGRPSSLKIWELNNWVTHFFPQADGFDSSKLDDALSPGWRLVKSAGEKLLSGFLGDRLEHRLQKLQITKHTDLAAQRGAQQRVTFSPDMCKGHYDGHRGNTLAAYQKRAEAYRVALNGKISKSQRS